MQFARFDVDNEDKNCVRSGSSSITAFNTIISHLSARSTMTQHKGIKAL